MSWLREHGNGQKETDGCVSPWCFQLQCEMAEKLSFCSQNEDYPWIGNEKLQTLSLARFQLSSLHRDSNSRVYVFTRILFYISPPFSRIRVKCIILCARAHLNFTFNLSFALSWTENYHEDKDFYGIKKKEKKFLLHKRAN